MIGISIINSVTHGMSGMVAALKTIMTIAKMTPTAAVLIATAPTQ